MRFLLLALVMVVPLRLPAQNYQWLTNYEHSSQFPNDIIRFFGIDTMRGPVHSNDWIATMNAGGGLPVFYGPVSTTKPMFLPGSPNPAGQFYGGPPTFNAPPVMIPERLDRIREQADYYLEVVGHQWYVSINGALATFYHWQEGTALDTLNASSVVLGLAPRLIVFVDGKVDIRGVLAHQDCRFVLGCSGDLRIVDDLKLWDTQNGHIRNDATSQLCIASEGSVLIGNTPENGRENRAQGSDVVITAMITALRGSFEIEQQNDVGDPYVCSCAPDERGTAFINGGIVQWNRGYLHRSNKMGTGYARKLLYDEQMRQWNTLVFNNGGAEYPDSLVFADTPVGQTAWDTVEVTGNGPFSGALATYPFATNAGYQFNGPDFTIPVSFTPPHAGPYFGTLSFFLAGEYHSIALRGVGVSSAPPIAPEIFPNPFNNVTSLSFTLPEAAHVRAAVYDVLGREVSRLADEAFIAGQHRLAVNAAAWSSGVYFLRLETLGQIETRKMLLIK